MDLKLSKFRWCWYADNNDCGVDTFWKDVWKDVCLGLFGILGLRASRAKIKKFPLEFACSQLKRLKFKQTLEADLHINFLAMESVCCDLPPFLSVWFINVIVLSFILVEFSFILNFSKIEYTVLFNQSDLRMGNA